MAICAGRAGSPAARMPNAPARSRGRTIGIVGMGAVGRAIAAIAQHGFGMRVIAHTRRNAGFPDGVGAVSLDELLARERHRRPRLSADR